MHFCQFAVFPLSDHDAGDSGGGGARQERFEKRRERRGNFPFSQVWRRKLGDLMDLFDYGQTFAPPPSRRRRVRYLWAEWQNEEICFPLGWLQCYGNFLRS